MKSEFFHVSHIEVIDNFPQSPGVKSRFHWNQWQLPLTSIKPGLHPGIQNLLHFQWIVVGVLNLLSNVSHSWGSRGQQLVGNYIPTEWVYCSVTENPRWQDESNSRMNTTRTERTILLYFSLKDYCNLSLQQARIFPFLLKLLMLDSNNVKCSNRHVLHNHTCLDRNCLESCISI